MSRRAKLLIASSVLVAAVCLPWQAVAHWGYRGHHCFGHYGFGHYGYAGYGHRLPPYYHQYPAYGARIYIESPGPASAAGEKPALPPGADQEAAPQEKAVPDSAVRLGADVFYRSCVRCHGPGARGRIGPSLVGIALDQSQIEATVRQGRPPRMPAFGNILSAEQIQAVASYIRSLGQDGAPAGQAPFGPAYRGFPYHRCGPYGPRWGGRW